MSHPFLNEIIFLRSSIIKWYKTNGRDYPWRFSKNPYEILISEILLQRTRAEQVLGVYLNFIKKYPTLKSLAEANYEELIVLTESLGLKWRIKKLLKLSKTLVEQYNSEIPSDREELLNLPGIGNYIAGIFLSSALNKKAWILDTNVVRVFNRFFGFEVKKNGQKNRSLIEVAKVYSDCSDSRSANYAIIDFGALVCKSRHQLHNICPISRKCSFYKSIKHSR